MSVKSTDLETPGSPGFGRRAFLGNVGLAAGAVLAASVLPVAAAQAASFAAPAAATSLQSRSVAGNPDELWDIDDMWGHWPRYAHPIPYARVQAPPALWEQVDPIDRMLVI